MQLSLKLSLKIAQTGANSKKSKKSKPRNSRLAGILLIFRLFADGALRP